MNPGSRLVAWAAEHRQHDCMLSWVNACDRFGDEFGAQVEDLGHALCMVAIISHGGLRLPAPSAGGLT